VEAVRAEAPEGFDPDGLMGRIGGLVIGLRTGRDVTSEAKAVAKWLGVPAQHVLFGACVYDLVMGYFACSAVALPSRNGPVLARNMDFWPEAALAQCSATIRASDSSGLRYLNLGWPGSIGVVTGLSTKGFALALNAVSHNERPPLDGYPVMLLLRKVLEQASGFDDAVDRLSTQRLASACIVMVVGTENHERVVVERSPTKFAIRRPQSDEPLVATNHYVGIDSEAPADHLLAASACARSERLTEITSASPASFGNDDEGLLYALTDSGVMMAITAQHTILRPREGAARLIIPSQFAAP
jgi:hypothetical protein